MTRIGHYFSDKVSTARSRFLAACDSVHIAVTAVPGIATGSEDDRQTIYADIARFGSPSANKVLVIAPMEGGRSAFVAAGIMTALISEKLYRFLDRDLALAVVHAINPAGPLWPLEAQENKETLELKQDNEIPKQEILPFDRHQLSTLPMTKLVNPAWEQGQIKILAQSIVAEADEAVILEIGDLPEFSNHTIVETEPATSRLTEGISEIQTKEGNLTSALLRHLKTSHPGLSGKLLQVRFHRSYREEKNKNTGHFNPDVSKDWQTPLWREASQFLEEIIKALGPNSRP